jgi:septal ring factor EnvC (AmiA/AmiB activator)
MSSQSRATRDSQKKLYDERLQARQNLLEKRGMAPTEFKKDKVYEHLKAKHQAIVKAIAAIDAGLARKQHAKDANKAAAAPAPTEKKQKKEKPEKAVKAPKAPSADSDK